MWEKTLDRLFQIADECVEENWDFNGEDSISPTVILNAIRVIRKLGPDFEPSKIKPMWDGRISLSFKEGETSFSIIVSHFHTQCVVVKNPGNKFDQTFLEVDEECLQKLRSFVKV